MGKISKSDTTPEMEREAETWRQKRLAETCQHFAVGTWIMSNNYRGQILSRYQDAQSTLLRVLWEDCTVSVVQPYALNRSK